MLSFIVNYVGEHRDHALRSCTARFEGKILLREKQNGDAVDAFLSGTLSFRLVSAHQLSGDDGIGILSPHVQLHNWNREINALKADEGILIYITFPVDEGFGNPSITVNSTFRQWPSTHQMTIPIYSIFHAILGSTTTKDLAFLESYSRIRLSSLARLLKE